MSTHDETRELAAEEEISSHTSTGRARLETLAVGLGALAASLTQSMLIPVLGVLPKDLDVSLDAVEWLLTATLLVAAVSMPLMGRLGDMFGKRLMLLVAIALLTLTSVVIALTSNIAVLIAARALQGASMAAVPLGISLLASMLPHDKRAGAVALISAMLGIGGALGIPLSAAVAQNADWHILFWIAAAVGLAAFLGILTVVPESPFRSGGKVDYLGTVLLSAALVAFFLPLAESSSWGWGDPWTIGLLAGSVVLVALFGAWERRPADPLVDLNALRRKPIVLTNIASIMIGVALFAQMIGTATYLQAPEVTGYGFGTSILTAGLCMLPSGVAMLAFTPVSAKLIVGWGAHYTLALGSFVVAVGWLLRIVLHAEIWEIVLAIVIQGAGTGIAYAAMPALINANTPHAELAAANGLNTLCRSIGTSLASALGGSILASKVMHLDGNEFSTFGAYRDLFWISVGASIVAVAVALLIPRQSDPHEF